MAELIDPDDLVGTAEAARLMGLSDGRISQLLRDDPTFPQPVAQVAATRLWLGSQITAWKTARGKVKPGRPSLKIKQMEEAVLKEMKPT